MVSMEPHLLPRSGAWSEVESRLKSPMRGWGRGQGSATDEIYPVKGWGRSSGVSTLSTACHLGFFPSFTNHKNQVAPQSSQELTPPSLSETKGKRNIFQLVCEVGPPCDLGIAFATLATEFSQVWRRCTCPCPGSSDHRSLHRGLRPACMT